MLNAIYAAALFVMFVLQRSGANYIYLAGPRISGLVDGRYDIVGRYNRIENLLPK